MEPNSTLLNVSLPHSCQGNTTRALLDDGGCDCHEGYGGARCDEVLAWWVTMERTRSVLGVALLLILLIWTVLKIAHSVRFKHWARAWNLVVVATLITAVGIAVRIASLPIQPRAYGPHVLRASADTASPYRDMLTAYGLLHGTAVAIVAASFNLMIGFWVDITSKVRTRITRRTKIACIVMSIAMAIVSGASIVSAVILQDATTLAIPIVISTFLDTLIVTGVIIYLVAPCCGASRVLRGAKNARASSTRARWRYMRRCLFAALGAWYVYVGTATLLGPLTAGPGQASRRAVLSYVTFAGELGFYTAVLFILDRKGGPLRLWTDLVRGESSIKTRHSRSATTSTPSGATPPRSTAASAIAISAPLSDATVTSSSSRTMMDTASVPMQTESDVSASRSSASRSSSDAA